MAAELIQTPQTLWKLGGYESVARSRFISLGCRVVSSGIAERWSTFRPFRGTAGYQVPTGFSLIITRILFRGDVGSMVAGLVDGTTDVGDSAAAAPAGAVEIDNPFAAAQCLLTNAASFAITDLQTHIVVPAARFIAARTPAQAASVMIHLFGHEE